MNATEILSAAGAIQSRPALPIWAYIAIGAAVGAVVGIVLLKKQRDERKEASGLPTLEKLLQRQIVCQTFTAGRFTAWADGCIQRHPDRELLFFVGRIKEETLPMFTASRAIPPQMKPANYLFVESVDSASKYPVDVDVVNCAQLDDILSEYLKDHDFQLITNERKSA